MAFHRSYLQPFLMEKMEVISDCSNSFFISSVFKGWEDLALCLRRII